MTIEYVTLASGSTLQDLTALRSQMYTMEASAPEGTYMQLICTLLPPPSWAQAVQPIYGIADSINYGMQQGGATLWAPGDQFATVKGDQIWIQWRKESIMIDLVALLIVAALGAFAYWAITHWVFQKTQSILGAPALNSSGSASTPTTVGHSILGTANLWAWALIAVGALAVVRQFLIDKERIEG